MLTIWAVEVQVIMVPKSLALISIELVEQGAVLPISILQINENQ